MWIILKENICIKCKEGFYLTEGDNHCIETKHCYESSFGLCTKCIRNYYLNKKENKCIKQDQDYFYKCQQTLNGKNCDKYDEIIIYLKMENVVKIIFVQKLEMIPNV